MANTDNPRGFKPVRRLDGAMWNSMGRMYQIASGDSSATFKYDLVVISGSAEALGIYATVDQAAAGNTQIVGSIVGIGGATYAVPYDPTNLTKVSRTASTNCYVMVVDDPWVVFQGQEDGASSSAIAVTGVGLNYDIVVGSGSTTTGLSAMEIDSSTGTTGSANVRLVGLSNIPGNVLGSASDGYQATWDVQIVEHYFNQTSGT